MKRFLIVLLVVGGLLSIPTVRFKVWAGLQPTLTRIEPYAGVILTPIRRYRAKTEVMAIVREIRDVRNKGGAVPNTRTFQRWLTTRRELRQLRQDPWGRPYYLERERGQLIVGSAGADGKTRTADDVAQTIPFPD